MSNTDEGVRPEAAAASPAVTRDTSSDGRPPAHIVVGVDGSPASVAALRRAAAMIGGMGGRLDVVTSWDYPAMAVDALPDVQALDALAAEAQHEALLAVFGETVPEGVQPRIVRGGAARVLTEASRGADMLVVGSRGHGGFVGLLIGSVSRACAEHAKCDVLIVRP